MKLIQEFKEFAIKGNVVDMAVGVIIGVAFGKIVSSLVADVIMPPVGALIGGVDFKHLKLVIVPNEPEVAIRYGLFLQTVFDFLIVAICVFAMVKIINHFKRKPPEPGAAPSPPAPEVQLLTEIRDLLKHK